jgi:hypothetical protein
VLRASYAGISGSISEYAESWRADRIGFRASGDWFPFLGALGDAARGGSPALESISGGDRLGWPTSSPPFDHDRSVGDWRDWGPLEPSHVGFGPIGCEVWGPCVMYVHCFVAPRWASPILLISSAQSLCGMWYSFGLSDFSWNGRRLSRSCRCIMVLCCESYPVMPHWSRGEASSAKVIIFVPQSQNEPLKGCLLPAQQDPNPYMTF